MKIGDAVVFRDQHGVSHTALLTAVWGSETEEAPPVNLVYVAGDETLTDSYGRQIARSTSVVHRSKQAAPGMYWSQV